MALHTEDDVKALAKCIYEDEKPENEVWGTETPDGAWRRENDADPGLFMISDEKRARYMKRAREQLETESNV